MSVVSDGRQSDTFGGVAAHAPGRRWSESRMREIRKSGSMRGNWKHALLARNGLLWQEEPRLGGAPVPYSTPLLRRRHFAATQTDEFSEFIPVIESWDCSPGRPRAKATGRETPWPNTRSPLKGAESGTSMAEVVAGSSGAPLLRRRKLKFALHSRQLRLRWCEVPAALYPVNF